MKTRSMIIFIAVIMLLFTACSSDVTEINDTAKEVVTKSEMNASKKIKESVQENDVVAVENKSSVKSNKTSSKAQGSGSGNTKVEQPKNNESKMPSKSESVSKQKTTEPKHTHSWTPVYSERQVQRTKKVPWTKCYACGADMTGNISHIDAHLENHESNVHYGTEYRDETYYETESYISGYRCSCGASK